MFIGVLLQRERYGNKYGRPNGVGSVARRGPAAERVEADDLRAFGLRRLRRIGRGFLGRRRRRFDLHLLLDHRAETQAIADMRIGEGDDR